MLYLNLQTRAEGKFVSMDTAQTRVSYVACDTNYLTVRVYLLSWQCQLSVREFCFKNHVTKL